MGKCSIDKMAAGMANELVTEGIDVVSWWAEEPMQTDEVQNSALEGTKNHRGGVPIMNSIMEAQGFGLVDLFNTTLAG